MGCQPSIYDFPDVYDAVLRAPLEQIEMEVSSVLQFLAKRGITQGHILELACGTCTHGILLAQHGFSATGMDISPKMLEGAAHRASSAGVHVALFQGDLINFSLDAGPFDCVLFMAETFPLLTEYEDIQSHFRVVRRHLKKGGIYVVDIDAHTHGIGAPCEVWGQRTVHLDRGWVEVWHEDLPGDWVRGTHHLVMHCRIRLGDTVHETTDDWRIRMDSPWNLSVLVKTLEEWTLTGFFSWRDLSPDIVDEEHYFMILE